MQIELQKIIPVPLKDKFAQRGSDVWNKELRFLEREWIKLKAPSGTGKTTLVHIIYKLRSDYEGNVLWDNNNLRSIASNELAKMRQQYISIVFQDLRLFPNLTAKENIELNRVLQKPIYESRAIEVMAARLNISHILQQRAALCSYGEQQRIAIIRALVQPFEWLIMDEPFSHLDEENIKRASGLIAEECDKRNAGFVITDLEDDTHFHYTKQLNL